MEWKYVSLSHVWLFATTWTITHQAPLCSWDFPGKNTGGGSHSLLQRIFLTQGSNPGLLNCTWILYHLSHQGSPWNEQENINSSGVKCSELECFRCLVAQSCPTLCDHHWLQQTRPPCPSLSPRICSNSCPLNWWCHPSISSSLIPFSSCLQSFLALRSFPMSWLFPLGGQTTGASASVSVLPMNIQDWFPLGLTGLISLLSKGCSIVLHSTTVQKHQFCSTQLFLWSSSHICTWLLEKP